MTQPNITPQGFRTATYLETKARMDAARSRSGKTRRQVTCTPPNVKCGGRCIPPNWDCRLKGKGADPALRAVKTDPLGGLANIQRGASRIAKGVVRGNISEVEGGKRAIIRGVVKASPGDLQRKKELTKKLEDQTRVIGTGLLVTTTALGAHALLMKRNTFGYRDGIGANINDSVRLGISKVLDATPVLKANRARARALAQGGVAAELERQRNPYTAQLTEQLARTKFTATDETGNSNLSMAVAAIDQDKTFTSATARFEDWDKAHQSAFWSTKRAGRSVFAEPATNEFLTRQFNLKGDDALTSKSIKDAMEFKLKKYKEDLVELAAVQGYKIKTSGTSRNIAQEDRRSFIKGLVKSTLPKGEANDKVRAALTKSLEDTINQAPVTRVNDIYKSTLDGFDSFYSSKAAAIETARIEPIISSAMRESGSAQVLPDARIARAAFVTGKQIKGTAQAELLMREYFFQKVKGTPRTLFPVTDRLATAAASEIEGRSVTPTEAFRILEREGINGAVPTERSSTRAASRATSTPKGQATRPARRRSKAQRIADLMRQKNKDGTPRYATREAAEAALKRMRKDELQQARIDAYLAVREDLRGKPCGASHIPKAHKCAKTQGRTVEQQKKRETVPQDREYKQLREIEREIEREAESKASNNPEPSNKINKKAVLAVIAAGATAATGAYVIQDLKKVAKDPNMFSATPPTKSVAKAAKKEFDTKKTGTAMGDYYTQKSGLKPGDVVYYRDKKDPAAHFGVYLGEGKDGKIRAVMANTNEKRAGFVDVVEIGTTKRDSNDAAHILFPVLQKAPPLKGAKARTNEETVRRALRAVGTDYKFSLTRDNCEVLANSIAYDTPRSQQLERFTRITRAVADNTVGTRQRVGMALRRAQGQRKTAALTATQILQRLSRDDNTFITKEGRDLARAQYSQYFNNSAKLDAAAPLPSILVSPEELWKRIKDYDDDKKAVAMRDYLLVTRLALGV